MKAVADTLAVVRSNLIERVSGAAKPRRPYCKAGDEPPIGADPPADGRASDLRVPRLVNRRQKAEGKPKFNAKQVLWIMQATNWPWNDTLGGREGARTTAS